MLQDKKIHRFFRRLPAFKGKGRMFRTLFFQKLIHSRDILCTGDFGCQYLLPNLTESVSQTVFIYGIYEKNIHKLLNELLPVNGTFLDIGANIGAVTIPLQVKRPDIKIIAVEAAPWVYEYLQTNLNRNKLHDIVAVNSAIYDVDDLQLDFFSPKEGFGKGSLSPVFTDVAVKVSTVTIDTLLRRQNTGKIDCMKVDVEGYEYHVFKGAAGLLNPADAPDILFEFVDWAEERAQNIQKGDAQRILKQYGYRLFDINDNGIGSELKDVLTEGSYMLYATKKKNVRD